MTSGPEGGCSAVPPGLGAGQASGVRWEQCLERADLAHSALRRRQRSNRKQRFQVRRSLTNLILQERKYKSRSLGGARGLQGMRVCGAQVPLSGSMYRDPVASSRPRVSCSLFSLVAGESVRESTACFVRKCKMTSTAFSISETRIPNQRSRWSGGLQVPWLGLAD